MNAKKSSPVKNIVITLILTLIAAGSFGAYLTLTVDEPKVFVGYAAGRQKDIPIYMMKEDGSMEQAGSVVRGTKIKKYEDREIIGGKSYLRLKNAEKLSDEIKKRSENSAEEELRYYVAEDDTSDSKDEIVKETEIYVRTSATIYSEESGPSIASFAPKGSCLKVTGYDKLMEDGSVYKYKVEEGYIFSRYTAPTQEEADAVYNENGVYDKVKNDKYGMELYGGSAANLDYYPRPRTAFKGNEFCADAKTMYINGQAAVNPKEYVKIIKETECNAVVIDIKDGYLAYKSEVAKELSPNSYKTAYSSAEEYKKGINAYRKAGVYLIGRIVVFNDPLYAKDHPEDCIKYGKNAGWPSAFSRGVWEYNVRLALEAAEKFGFNEIQFDYVRFPESSYEMSKSGKADFRNKFDEEKGQAVQNFCIYAADMLHEKGIYMSVDVFGESAYGYMTAYGQYWPGISNVVDAISAMPYTDHMGSENSWETPYKTMLSWSKKAVKQQSKLENPAAARTWITGYNTPHWNPTVDYDKEKLKAQVKALNKAGLSGGFIPWNASSDIAKYKQYKDVWN